MIVVDIMEDMAVNGADECREHLKRLIAEDTEIVVDMSYVGRLEKSLARALADARGYAAKEGKVFRLKRTCDTVIDQLISFGYLNEQSGLG